MQIFGLIFFSFAISSLTAIISNLNKYDEEVRAKLDTLEDIKRRSEMGPGLFDLARQSLVYQSKQDQSAAINLIQCLPYRIQVEVSNFIMKAKISKIKFFSDKTKDFRAFAMTLMSSQRVNKGMYIFSEGDNVKSVYFLISGKAAYAIEGEKAIIYISIKPGDKFGFIDLVSSDTHEKGKIIREFSVLAVDACEVVKLSVQDLISIKDRYPQVYNQMFQDMKDKYKKAYILKKR